MNMDRLLQRVIKMGLSMFTRAGLDTANEHLRKSGKGGAPLTKAEKKQTGMADELAKKAKQLQKITRRMR